MRMFFTCVRYTFFSLTMTMFSFLPMLNFIVLHFNGYRCCWCDLPREASRTLNFFMKVLFFLLSLVYFSSLHQKTTSSAGVGHYDYVVRLVKCEPRIPGDCALRASWVVCSHCSAPTHRPRLLTSVILLVLVAMYSTRYVACDTWWQSRF